MSSDRELRDRIEALQVELRHAKEQLADAQARLVASEAERRLLAEQAEAAARSNRKLEHVLAARRPRGGAEPLGRENVAILALASLPSDLDTAIGMLSSATGLGIVDLRLKLRGEVPRALVRMEKRQAQALATALRENDIDVVLCDAAPPVKLEVVRASVTPDELELTGRQGEVARVAYGELQLAVVGRRTSSDLRLELELGGSRLRQVMVKDETSRDFLWLWAEEQRRFELIYPVEIDGLPGPRPLSAAATFRSLADQLKRHAPRLVIDDRLVRLASSQQPLLGDQAHVLLGELLYAAVVRT